jgi:K+-transporting ATPase A subunit
MRGAWSGQILSCLIVVVIPFTMIFILGRVFKRTWSRQALFWLWLFSFLVTFALYIFGAIVLDSLRPN